MHCIGHDPYTALDRQTYNKADYTFHLLNLKPQILDEPVTFGCRGTVSLYNPRICILPGQFHEVYFKTIALTDNVLLD